MVDDGGDGSAPVTAFHEALLAHVAGPDDGTWGRLRSASGDLASGDGPGRSVGIARDIGGRIGPILDGEPVTWGCLLFDLEGAGAGHLRDRALAASPFRGKALVFRQSPGPREVRYIGDVGALPDDVAKGSAALDIGDGVEMYVFPVRASDGPAQADDDGSVGC